MLIETASTTWARSHATDATDTSFASRIPTITKPSGDGVIGLGDGGALCSNGLMLLPYGTGSDNDTFDMRIRAWRDLTGNQATPTKALWVPVLLAQFACTLSAAVGVAGAILGTTARFVDTITLTMGNSNVSVEIVSPGSDQVAHIVVDAKGARLVEVTFDLGAGSGANCLYALL